MSIKSWFDHDLSQNFSLGRLDPLSLFNCFSSVFSELGICSKCMKNLWGFWTPWKPNSDKKCSSVCLKSKFSNIYDSLFYIFFYPIEVTIFVFLFCFVYKYSYILIMLKLNCNFDVKEKSFANISWVNKKVCILADNCMEWQHILTCIKLLSYLYVSFFDYLLIISIFLMLDHITVISFIYYYP